MELISVLVAAAAAFGYGAVHYIVLSGHWVAASGVKVDENGRPLAQNAKVSPFLLSGIAMVLVAGMMRHILTMSGVNSVGGAIISGLGIGAFLVVPWVMINNAFAGRPFMLTVIDGAYAIVGCGIIGAVLAIL
ncbi:MAG: DUF1761 domain-containing protein [Cypionkella sp.]|nr:DUF1761 domain-containing protein [Cypionkella sp.]